MSKAARKPQIGDTVVVVTKDYTYTGTVTDILDTQFIYSVTHINNTPSPMKRANSWEKFCFFSDPWKIKPMAIDHSSRY